MLRAGFLSILCLLNQTSKVLYFFKVLKFQEKIILLISFMFIEIIHFNTINLSSLGGRKTHPSK